MNPIRKVARVVALTLSPTFWKQTLSAINTSGGWWPVIRESYAGAWQQNVEVRLESVLAFHAVFACITLIQDDVGKLRPKLVERDVDGIWSEVDSTAFSPVLRKPNRYQNHIQFKQWWIASKLIRGNTYALKQRDRRGVVVALYLLDPCRVTPMITDDGSIYYRLGSDNLSGIKDTDILVPASEIIHDRINCLFHPLVGLSPIFACGLASTQGIAIQNNSTRLFSNMSRPSGILTAPGAISDANAARLKEQWQAGYSGENYGKVAVLGDGLKYEKMSLTAEEAQLIEQLKWTAEVVCSCFHMPPFKIGVGTMPTYQNGEVLNQIYYSDCLQSHIESFETCMDEGLGLSEKIDGRWLGVELDLDGLLRMDTATQMKMATEGVTGGVLKPNEARRKFDLKPVQGGNSVFLQQQNYSLEALAKRDAQEDPFKPAPAALPAPEPGNTDDSQAEEISTQLNQFRHDMTGLVQQAVDAAQKVGADTCETLASLRKEISEKIQAPANDDSIDEEDAIEGAALAADLLVKEFGLVWA